jgi:hypothetical protein
MIVPDGSQGGRVASPGRPLGWGRLTAVLAGMSRHGGDSQGAGCRMWAGRVLPQPSTKRTANLIDQIESDLQRRSHCELPGSAFRCRRLTRPLLRLPEIDISSRFGLPCRGRKRALGWTRPAGKGASPISRRKRWSPGTPLNPAMRWRRVVSRASASVMAGRIVVSRRARLDGLASGHPA